MSSNFKRHHMEAKTIKSTQNCYLCSFYQSFVFENVKMNDRQKERNFMNKAYLSVIGPLFELDDAMRATPLLFLCLFSRGLHTLRSLLRLFQINIIRPNSSQVLMDIRPSFTYKRRFEPLNGPIDDPQLYLLWVDLLKRLKGIQWNQRSLVEADRAPYIVVCYKYVEIFVSCKTFQKVIQVLFLDAFNQVWSCWLDDHLSFRICIGLAAQSLENGQDYLSSLILVLCLVFNSFFHTNFDGLIKTETIRSSNSFGAEQIIPSADS